MAHRAEIETHLADLLAVDRFKDYGPNGLQVEGRAEVRRVVSGVTASLALIEAAIDLQADAVLVHHGLFWRGQDGRVVGWMRRRLSALLARYISLFAYHLPLDAHAGHRLEKANLVAHARHHHQRPARDHLHHPPAERRRLVLVHRCCRCHAGISFLGLLRRKRGKPLVGALSTR